MNDSYFLQQISLQVLQYLLQYLQYLALDYNYFLSKNVRKNYRYFGDAASLYLAFIHTFKIFQNISFDVENEFS